MTQLTWALVALVALVLVLVALVVIIRGPDAVRQLLGPGVRRWLYGLATAALGLLSTLGIIHGELVAAWGYLLAALFDVARQNVNDPAPRHAGVVDMRAPDQ